MTSFNVALTVNSVWLTYLFILALFILDCTCFGLTKFTTFYTVYKSLSSHFSMLGLRSLNYSHGQFLTVSTIIKNELVVPGIRHIDAFFTNINFFYV